MAEHPSSGDDRRVTSEYRVERLEEPVAIATLRRVAQESLSPDAGRAYVDEHGVHREFGRLPRDVALELLERIDGGATMEDFGPWLADRLGLR